jgi:phage terminase large subunit GpA-like protein
VVALTAGGDTQHAGFYYEIRAWAAGPQLESWQIDEGFVDSAAGLLEVLFESDYRAPEGRAYPVNLVIQDAMGHRTAEVYDLTRLHRRRHLPYQGARSLTTPYTYTQLEFYPAARGRKKPIPGGLRLVRGNSTFYKDQLAAKLAINPAAPGAWHLHSETTEEYARQMCAEYVDEKNLWQCKPGHANHFWDCGYLNLLAADILRLKMRKPARPVPVPEPEPAGPPADDPLARTRKRARPRSKKRFIDAWKK